MKTFYRKQQRTFIYFSYILQKTDPFPLRGPALNVEELLLSNNIFIYKFNIAVK